MAQQGKGKGLAIVLSFVAIGGVVAYIIYRNYKNKNQNPTDGTLPLDQTQQGGGGSGSGSGSGGSSGSTSSGNPFATTNDLLKFQRWVIVTKGDKTILGKGGSTGFGDDGQWGSKSASAYSKYQSGYNPAIVNSDGSISGVANPQGNLVQQYPSPTAQFLPSWLLPSNTGGSGEATGSVKSTESNINIWSDMAFRPNKGGVAGSRLLLKRADGSISYDSSNGSYVGEATGVIVKDANGVEYREVIAPTTRRDMFKDSNNVVIPKAYVSKKKTTKI